MREERLRTFAAIMSGAAIALVLIGCGDAADDSPPATVEQPAARPAPEPAELPAVVEEPAVVEQPAVVPQVVEGPSGLYTVQLSSWRTQAKADREARRYRGMGIEAYVQRADLPETGTWYRVRFGRYPALSEARRAAASAVDVEDLWVDNFTAGDSPAER
jgi:cell division septation protein DedD